LNYRYYLKKEDKFSVSINSRFFQVDNLSAGGIAFYGDYCREKDVYFFNIKVFYDVNFNISGKLEIVSFADGICRGKFLDLHESDYERLHKLVFKMQLRNIRDKRNCLL